MHTYPWHVGDYLKDCAHLDNDEDLAYRRLMDLYYTQEGPIPNKTQWVAKRIRMVGKEVAIAAVLKEFFDLDGGVWTQKRCDTEIVKYLKKAATSRNNGKSGGRPPAGIPRKTQQVTTRTRTRTINTPLSPEGVAAFGLLWDKYPRKVGKPKALIAYAAALSRGAKSEEVMAGLLLHIACQQWQDLTKVPHPTTWLNRDGWNDQVVSPPGASDAAPSANWWNTKSGILDKGLTLGIPAPADELPATWFQFMASVWVAAGHDGPWWDRKSVAYPIAVKLRDGGVSVTSQRDEVLA